MAKPGLTRKREKYRTDYADGQEKIRRLFGHTAQTAAGPGRGVETPIACSRGQGVGGCTCALLRIRSAIFPAHLAMFSSEWPKRP